jgi:uncharacterized protein YjbI with pentapeptide repeats
MAEFHEEKMPGSSFEKVDLTGASFRSVHLKNATFRDVDMSGTRFRAVGFHHVTMRGVELGNTTITGEVFNLVINGVDVAPLIDAELNRREPERAKMRPTDPAGYREAWDIVERRWQETIDRAAKLDPALLHESVDDEWSFIETQRHLVFATDCWVRRGILRDPSPWHPLDLPWDDMEPTPGIPWDREVRPTLDEVLEVRRDRMSGVREMIEGLTPERLTETVIPADTPGWPTPEMRFPVSEALLTVLNEEWEHRNYAERDLAVMQERAAQ